MAPMKRRLTVLNCYRNTGRVPIIRLAGRWVGPRRLRSWLPLGGHGEARTPGRPGRGAP
jgi:hypothetical protein